MANAKPRLRRTPDELGVEGDSWLDLGQLRELVRMADERGWPDSALVSHSIGSEHVYRHDIRIARRIVIEGCDPEP